MIDEPLHAKSVELLIEEFDSKLAGKQRHVLYDGQPDAPLVVFGQFDDGRQQGLRQFSNTNDFINAIQIRYDVQSDLRSLKFSERER